MLLYGCIRSSVFRREQASALRVSLPNGKRTAEIIDGAFVVMISPLSVSLGKSLLL